MKLPQKNNRKNKKNIRTFAVIALTVLFLLGAFVIYTKINHSSIFGWYPFGESVSNPSINLDPPSDEEIDAGNSSKDDTVNNPDPTKPGSEQNTSDNEQPSSNTDNVTVRITSTSQTTTTLRVNTMIEAVSNEGSCTIKLSHAGSTEVSQTSTIQPLTSYSTCRGFEIPLSQLSDGTWTILLTYSSGSYSGSVSQSVEIVR